MARLAIVISLDCEDPENYMTRYCDFKDGAKTIKEIQSHRGWRILETYLSNGYGQRLEEAR